MIIIICFIAGAMHLGISIFHALAFTRYGVVKERQPAPFISIIIAARNEEDNLKRLIPRLLEQEYSQFEIVVGLDRCSDKSRDYLQELNSSRIKFVDIEEVQADWDFKKYALNKAIEVSVGEWLVFTDADCLPYAKQWLVSFLDHIKTEIHFVVGVSPYETNSSFLSQYIGFEGFHTAFLYTSRALMNVPYMAVARNMAVRKSYFEQMGGYESIKSITGGDDDLLVQLYATKKNTKTLLGLDSLVQTFPEKNWKDYWDQKIRHFSVSKNYNYKDKAFLSLFHASHLVFLIFLISHLLTPYFLPAIFFYLSVKFLNYRFVASRIGMSINYKLLPIVDVLYAIFTPTIALLSTFKKNVKWKN